MKTNSFYKLLCPFLITIVIGLFSLTSIQAVVLVAYDFNGGNGNASSIGPGIVNTLFIDSPGIGTPAFTNGYVEASGWENTETGSDYYTFSFSNLNADSIDLTAFTFSEEKQNGNSPANWRIGIDVGSGFVEPDIAGGTSNGATSTSFTQHVVDLSGLQVAASGSVDVRIYGFNAPHSNQKWRIDNVSLEGNISAVPEPHEYAMVASLLLVGFAGFRRWKFAQKSA